MPVSKKGTPAATASSVKSVSTPTNNGSINIVTEYIFDSFGGSDIKTLMDGNANNLLTLAAGDTVLDCRAYTSVAAGSAGTFDVGNDANWSLGTDGNSLIAALDMNTGGSQRTIIDGNAAQRGITVTTGTGNVTVQSSSDLSASSWQGGVAVRVSQNIA